MKNKIFYANIFCQLHESVRNACDLEIKKKSIIWSIESLKILNDKKKKKKESFFTRSSSFFAPLVFCFYIKKKRSLHFSQNVIAAVYQFIFSFYVQILIFDAKIRIEIYSQENVNKTKSLHIKIVKYFQNSGTK